MTRSPRDDRFNIGNDLQRARFGGRSRPDKRRRGADGVRRLAWLAAGVATAGFGAQAGAQQDQQPAEQAQQQPAEQVQQQPAEQAQQQPAGQAQQQPAEQAQQQPAEQAQEPEQQEQQEVQQAQRSTQEPERDDQQEPGGNRCGDLPDHATLTEQIRSVVAPGDASANGGLGNHVWAVLVDRHGTICAVARSGQNADEQWLGSRAIAASKAFTANAFSLPSFALSTANLYWPSQPESSLYDLGFGNPVNPLALYGGDVEAWGTPDDPLTGRRIGGTTVFGGGLALYSSEGDIVGALGVSGDESCTDHVVAWRVRHGLNLDNVPDGPTPAGNDNIIYDLTVHPASGQRRSASGYGHPVCSPDAQTIAERFPQSAPTGPN